MLMALSWSFQLLINKQTQHKEPLSQIQACNSILWAVTQCSLHLGKRIGEENRIMMLEAGVAGSFWEETAPKFFYFYDDKPKFASPRQETSGNLHIVFSLVFP